MEVGEVGEAVEGEDNYWGQPLVTLLSEDGARGHLAYQLVELSLTEHLLCTRHYATG